MNNLNMDKIGRKILDIYSSYAKDQHITLDDKFADLNINSIDYIKIMVKIENEFNFEFSDDDLADNTFPTIRDLVTYVGERLDDN